MLSLGTKAEYGSFSGVAIDVLIKSGGSTFHGDLAYFKMLDSDENQPSGNTGFGKDWLQADPDAELMLIPDYQQDIEATLGGPIVKNKLWFYAGFSDNAADTKEPYFPLLKEYRGELYDIKLTAEPNPKNLAWLAYHFEDTTNANGSWGRQNWDPTLIYTENAESYSISAQWQWIINDRTFLSVKYLGFDADSAPTLPAGVPDNPGYVNWWKWGTIGVGGAHAWIEGMDSERDTIQADVSHYADDFLGEHDLKFGVQYTNGASNWTGGYFQGYANFAYPEPWTQNVTYLQDWYSDTGLRIYVNEDTINPFLTVRNTDSQGVFFDDQWVVNDKLTLNLGLRYDKMTAGYGTGKVYEQPATADGINDPPPVIRDRQGTGDIFDFKTWSPRIGATYQLTDDGKTVLRASFGRFYAPVTTENLRRFGPDMPLTYRRVLHYSVPFEIADADGDGFIDTQNLMDATRALPGLDPVWIDDQGLRDDSWQLQVDEGLDDTYTDQLTLSLAREVRPNLAVEASYIYKKTGDILVNWPINRQTQGDFVWDRVSYTAASTGNTFDVYTISLVDYNGDGVVDLEDARWVTDNIDYRVRNLGTVDGIPGERTYHGFQLAFQKRYSNRWQAMGSFLYSDSDGVASRTSHQDWYIDGPMIMDTAFVGSPNNLVNNMEGQLPMTPKYSLKFAGSYTIPKVEVDLGFRFRYSKGRPLAVVEVIPQFASWMGQIEPNMILSTGGGGGGGFIAGDADLLPNRKILDLSLGRDIPLGGDFTLNVTLDVLNALNDDTVNDAGYHDYDYGQVLSLVSPRIYRLGVRFRF
ncbi:MAG: TonB-dependent receptor [bacterium]|nr:TonB-dependent receptor [bacterium]